MAATVASNITPGKKVIQYAPDKIKSNPFEINDPKDGSVTVSYTHLRAHET